jgi:hypothetical protein
MCAVSRSMKPGVEAVRIAEARRLRLKWFFAFSQAVRELKVPPRGERGSRANRERRELMPTVLKRAREIFGRTWEAP